MSTGNQASGVVEQESLPDDEWAQDEELGQDVFGGAAWERRGAKVHRRKLTKVSRGPDPKRSRSSKRKSQSRDEPSAE